MYLMCVKCHTTHIDYMRNISYCA